MPVGADVAERGCHSRESVGTRRQGRGERATSAGGEALMSRIADTFAHLRSAGKRGLVAYVTAGDPDLARTAEILVSLSANGADVLEVGVPFSDPLADGPVIQRASERALASGTSLRSS